MPVTMTNEQAVGRLDKALYHTHTYTHTGYLCGILNSTHFHIYFHTLTLGHQLPRKPTLFS